MVIVPGLSWPWWSSGYYLQHAPRTFFFMIGIGTDCIRTHRHLETSPSLQSARRRLSAWWKLIVLWQMSALRVWLFVCAAVQQADGLWHSLSVLVFLNTPQIPSVLLITTGPPEDNTLWWFYLLSLSSVFFFFQRLQMFVLWVHFPGENANRWRQAVFPSCSDPLKWGFVHQHPLEGHAP